MAHIRIALLGADGSMGRHIARLALQDEEIDIVKAYTIPDSPNLGRDLGLLAGEAAIGVTLEPIDFYKGDCESGAAIDVVIDFTVAAATEINAPIALRAGIPVVIGTTGLSGEFEGIARQICEDKGCSSVIASNMATGVNVFFQIAQEIAKAVRGWDIEIIEAHHHRKRDSPSGTALTIAKKITEILGNDLDSVAKYGRDKGPNLREKGGAEIGIHAVRGGDIVGEHTVLYAGPGERIELVHRAHSRDCFASGALKAAKFIHSRKKEGKIYDMRAVLGLD